MGVWKALEPAMRAWRLLDECEHTFWRRVVNDVELVVELQADALVGRARIDIGRIFRPRLAEARKRRALPVGPLLPGLPFAVGVEAVELVRPDRNRWVEVVFCGVFDLLENMLGHNPRSVPANRERGVEARVRPLQLEEDSIFVRRRDRIHARSKDGSPEHAGV